MNGFRSSSRRWLHRYALAELAGVGTALLAGWLAGVAALPLLAIGYASAIGENVGFYGTIVGRQIAADRRHAHAVGQRYRLAQMWVTMRELMLEFGPAEVLDSLVIRPFAMALGVRLLGQVSGIVAGKLAADVTFYLPVILTYELRRRARRAAR
jgi:hypothetical protein